MAEAVLCKCGSEAVVKVCSKPGPNNGREFWTCESRSCNFFRSADGKPWIQEERWQPPSGSRFRGTFTKPPKRTREREAEIEEEPKAKKSLPIGRQMTEAARELVSAEKTGDVLLDRIIDASAKSLTILTRLEGLEQILKKLCPCGSTESDSPPNSPPATEEEQVPLSQQTFKKTLAQRGQLKEVPAEKSATKAPC